MNQNELERANKSPHTLYTDPHGANLMIRQQIFQPSKFVIYVASPHNSIECRENELLFLKTKIEEFVKERFDREGKYKKYESDSIILEWICPECKTLLTFTLTEFLTRQKTVCPRCKTQFVSCGQ